MVRLPPNKALAKIAVYGAVGCISAVMYMRFKIQDRIRNQDYFREALKTLRTHPGAVNLLGQPIKEVGFDLGNEEKNFCDGQIARFEVGVKGPKDRGTMFFWADRSEDGWLLKRLELEVKSQPEKRFLVKKDDSEQKIETIS